MQMFSHAETLQQVELQKEQLQKQQHEEFKKKVAAKS